MNIIIDISLSDSGTPGFKSKLKNFIKYTDPKNGLNMKGELGHTCETLKEFQRKERQFSTGPHIH